MAHLGALFLVIIPSLFLTFQVVESQSQSQSLNQNQLPSPKPVFTLASVNPEKESLLRRFNYFDLEILKEISESPRNIFISPASIKITLAMILEGAKGKSAKEIEDALRIDNIERREIREYLQGLLFDLKDSSGLTTIESSNGVFVNQNVKIQPDYQRKVSKFYRALVQNLDFTKSQESAKFINSWASNATHGAIPDIISSQNLAGASVLIANALYFKGTWKKPFQEQFTDLKCFQSQTRGCVKTPTMQLMGVLNYGLDADLNAHAVELPYQDDKYAMLLLIPNEGNNIKLLSRDMQHAKFNNILDQLVPKDLWLYMPKFEMEFNADLAEFLTPLKVVEIFGSAANLTGMVPQGGVRVSKIHQKAKIQVDEKGSVAAAITTAEVVPLISDFRVHADRPFLFFIYHKETRNILFEGTYVEPESDGSQQQQQPKSFLARSRLGPRTVRV